MNPAQQCPRASWRPVLSLPAESCPQRGSHRVSHEALWRAFGAPGPGRARLRQLWGQPCHRPVTKLGASSSSSSVPDASSEPLDGCSWVSLDPSQPWHPCSPGAGTLSGADACTHGILRCRPRRLNPLHLGQILGEVEVPIHSFFLELELLCPGSS